MILSSIQIFDLYSFIDSSEVKIDENLTCCIGKNETGKTSFLKCMYSIDKNQQRTPDLLCTYSEAEKKFTREEIKENEVLVIKAKFELEKQDITKLREYNPILKSLISNYWD